MTAAEHELRGTFKPSRHGGNSTAVRTNWAERLAAMRPDARGDGWKPGAAVLAALGTAGRRFVRGWLATYDVTRAEGMVLMQGAVAIDRLSELRARDRSTLSPREDGMVQRLARVHLRRSSAR